MTSLFHRKHPDPPAPFPSYLLPSLSFRRSSTTQSRHLSTDSNSSTNTTSTNNTTSTGRTSLSLDTPPSNPFSRCPTPIPLPADDGPIEEPTDKYLHGRKSSIHCSKCATDLALTSQIISKGFTGRHGRAYLLQPFPHNSKHIPSQPQTSTNNKKNSHGLRIPDPSAGPSLPNTILGKVTPRNLVTGQHLVSDIHCAICDSLLGWKYVETSEDAQKYKVGKFILETKKIRVGTRWDNDPGTSFGDTEDYIYDEIVPLSTEERGKLDDGLAKVQSKDDNEEEIEFDSQDEDECEDLFAGIWSPQLARRRRQRKSERYRRKARRVYTPGGGSLAAQAPTVVNVGSGISIAHGNGGRSREGSRGSSLRGSHESLGSLR